MSNIEWQLLLYFDKRGFLSDMKKTCEKFLEEINVNVKYKFPPLRYWIEIDVIDTLDMFPELGEFLLKEPLKWQRYCNEMLFACLQSVNDSCKYVSPAQAAVTIRLTCVPTALIQPNPSTYAGLVVFDGILLATSELSSYVYHTVWSCPEECEDNEVILHYIPKVSLRCYKCRSILFENSGYRRCGEQLTAIFQLKNNVLPKKIVIVDDLILRLKLGSRYLISAIVDKKITSVLSVEEIIPLPAPIQYCIPPDIHEVYIACDGNPWLFIYCLASGIGVDVCPINCFMNLKINILLSLASIKANIETNSAIVHIFATTYDSAYVGEIMKEAVNLADRYVVLGTSNSDASTALIASTGGICVLSLPLHIYRQKQIFAILSAIETEEIMTENCKVKLRSAVWAIGKDTKKLVLHNASNVFGGTSSGDYGQHSDEIANFILQRAIETVTSCVEDKKALKDVALYIDIVAGIKVVLDESAETLLRNYFLSARKEASKGVAVGSLTALVAMCLTSARLCRRSKTNIEDAVFAIWLHNSGSPELRLVPQEYLQTPDSTRKLRKIIIGFKEWLENFTGILLT